MGIRESINQKPSVAATVALVLAIAAATFIYLSWFRRPPPGPVPKMAYYTVDDGKTWFLDDMAHVPPYDHDGKEAVRAVLFRCGDNKPFVYRLEKYIPPAKTAIESAIAAGQLPVAAQGMMSNLAPPGLLRKLPGETEWVELKPNDMNTPLWDKYMIIKRPEGQTGSLRPVLPSENAQP